MSKLIIFSTALLALVSTSAAMMIEGKQMTMDDAIMKASSNSSEMFEIMQPDGSCMVEMDMKYPMDKCAEMRKEMADAEREETAGEKTRKKRKAIRQSNYRWTNKIVPYEISYIFSASDRQKISAAIADYDKYTCIRFRPAGRADRNKVMFQNGGGCSSYVGMIGGQQPISLAPGCRYKGIIIHEMGHAIGFQHEQTRPDRDGYVSIQSQNIQRGVAYNFMKYTTSQVNNHNVPYDYTSVMHYSQRAFSANGQPTILARDRNFQNAMGNREGLSYRDIQLANAIYDCASGCRGSCSQGFMAKDCKCYCDSGDRSNPLRECDGSVVTRTTPAPTVGPMTCRDRNTNCPTWASRGYCTRSYVTYMRQNCPYSCNICRTITTTTTTTTTTPTPAGDCVNRNRYCDDWAQRGECRRNPSYMLNNCKKACNACDSTQSVCEDMNSLCPQWTRYCNNSVYRSYLAMNCKKSCNKCTSNDVTAAPETTTKATNNAASGICRDLKPKVECEKYKDFCGRSPVMRVSCKKTCGRCRRV